jgi:ATP-dependent Lhr-like helicase
VLRWQHLTPQSQLSGEQGVLEALRSLEGFEAPALEWERSLLPQRVANYDPRWLDALCLSGTVGWGRISPHPAFYSADSGGPRRVVPTSMAPITFFLREEAHWMDLCLGRRQVPEESLRACLSDLALQIRAHMLQYGSAFAGDLARMLGAPAAEISHALWELVAAGLATADGFDSLRVLIDQRRKLSLQAGARTKAAGRVASGRWCLLGLPQSNAAVDPQRHAELREKQIESACRLLLRRYGIVFRDALPRESTIPRWRDLVGIFRRMEARGEIRGGRFLSGFGGEQYALPEALESLRELRRGSLPDEEITVSAADPMNLSGIVVPGERVPGIPGRTVLFTNGTCTENVVVELQPDEIRPVQEGLCLLPLKEPTDGFALGS